MTDDPIVLRVGSVVVPFELVRRLHLRTVAIGTMSRVQGYLLLNATGIGVDVTWNYRESVTIHKGADVLFSGLAVGARVLWRGKRLVLHLEGQSVFLEYGTVGAMLTRGLPSGHISAFVWRAMLSSRYPNVSLSGFDEVPRERAFLFAIPLRNAIWTKHESGYLVFTDCFITCHSDQPQGVDPTDLAAIRSRDPEWSEHSVKIVGSVRANNLHDAWVMSTKRANATLDLLHSVARLGLSQVPLAGAAHLLEWDLTSSLAAPALSNRVFLKDLEQGGGYVFANLNTDLSVPFDVGRLEWHSGLIASLRSVHLVNSYVVDNPVREDSEAATVARAFSWLRSARDQSNPSERILHVWFAVESLLSVDWFVKGQTPADQQVLTEVKRAIKQLTIPDGASLTKGVLLTRLLRGDLPIMSKLDQLCQRVGVAIATDERDLLDRIRRLRGKLVHTGLEGNITPEEVARLEFVVERLLYGCVDALARKYPQPQVGDSRTPSQT